ncbi:TPA: hypothetical protein ACGOYQ_001962 [Streptococcus suis]
MKKILFHFPLRYYLNPVNILGTVFMLFVEYTKWQNLYAKIAEFETYNVKHYHNQFELIPSTVLTIIWVIFNILLYPYVFDALLKLTSKYIKKSYFLRGLWTSSISIYQAEKARGNQFIGYRPERNAGGWITGLVPEYDDAGSRAFTAASNNFIVRLSIGIAPYLVLILLLFASWLPSAFIGWFFAFRFHANNKE